MPTYVHVWARSAFTAVARAARGERQRYSSLRSRAFWKKGSASAGRSVLASALPTSA
jgi:hypothetical protein